MKMSRYLLVPVDGGDQLPIKIPPGLVCNTLFDAIKSRVKDKSRLSWLIKQLALNCITEDDDGVMICKDKRIPDVMLRDAIIDTCNNLFLEKNESFYKILRNFNITF